MRGERGGGLLLGRFYFSKWLTFPVLGHKKVLVIIINTKIHRIRKKKQHKSLYLRETQ